MEVWFYHLERQALEAALPTLAEKALARGWRVVVQAGGEAALKRLDDALWAADPVKFLPHGLASDPRADRQPILLTTGGDKDGGSPNGAALRMYVDGAEVDLDPAAAGYERAMVLFDGRDEDAVAAARRQWSRLKAQGFALAYWQQSEEGRWDRRQ